MCSVDMRVRNVLSVKKKAIDVAFCLHQECDELANAPQLHLHISAVMLCKSADTC